MSTGVRFSFLNIPSSACHGFHCHGAVSRSLSVFNWLPEHSHTYTVQLKLIYIVDMKLQLQTFIEYSSLVKKMLRHAAER